MAVALLSVDAPTVAEGQRQTGDMHMPKVAGAILQPIELELRQGSVAFKGEQHEVDCGAMLAKQGEIDAVGRGRRSQGLTAAAGGAVIQHGYS